MRDRVIEKPRFRGREHATTFQEASVVDVYGYRPPYPDAVFGRLAELVDPAVDALLDVGTGPGDVARPMAEHVGRVDAVDFSGRMLDRARSLPGGDRPNIRWIESDVETAELAPPYGLITAAACLHWFDLNVVMPRFADLLSPDGYLAIVERSFDVGVEDGEIIGLFSTNQDYEPWDCVKAVVDAGLFEPVGTEAVGTIDWCPTVDAFLNCRHSQNGLSRDRMGADASDAYDREVRALVERQVAAGTLRLDGNRLVGTSTCTVVWGKPKGGSE